MIFYEIRLARLHVLYNSSLPCSIAIIHGDSESYLVSPTIVPFITKSACPVSETAPSECFACFFGYDSASGLVTAS